MTIDIFILLLQGAIVLALLRIDRRIGRLLNKKAEDEAILQQTERLKEGTDKVQTALGKQA